MARNQGIGKLLFLLGFFVIGIVMIVIGSIGLKQAGTWPATTGEIQSIELIHEAVDVDDDDVYEVMVKYTVDGKTYVSDLGVAQDDFEVGKVIDILYDPANPDAITLPGKTGPTVAIIGGVVAIIVGIITLIRMLARGR